jgi:hypothetical protein
MNGKAIEDLIKESRDVMACPCSLDLITISTIKKQFGFVNNPRSCVAISRSKRKTIIVGGQRTLTKSKFLSRSIDTKNMGKGLKHLNIFYFLTAMVLHQIDG